MSNAKNKLIIALCLILSLTLLSTSRSYAFDLKKNKVAYASSVYNAKINKNKLVGKESRLSRVWHVIKGKPSKNAILLGMFSYHTMKERRQLNQSNKLAAIEYKGYSIGTFYNSYHVQTYYVGLSRKLYDIKLPWDSSMQLKYRVVAMHGYQRYEPDLFGITPTVVPVIGFTNKHFGVDFLVSMGKTLTFATNFRVNIDDLFPAGK